MNAGEGRMRGDKCSLDTYLRLSIPHNWFNYNPNDHFNDHPISMTDLFVGWSGAFVWKQVI